MPKALLVSSVCALGMLASACATVHSRMDGYTYTPLGYYDAQHADYHYWTRDEREPYAHWEAEQHRAHVQYKKLTSQDQASYWEWRHSHR